MYVRVFFILGTTHMTDKKTNKRNTDKKTEEMLTITLNNKELKK